MMGEVESVFAVARTALVDIEVEDTAVAVLKFASGAIGVIEATTATRPVDLEGSLSLLGKNGSIVVGGFALNRLETWNFNDFQETDAATLDEFSVNPPDVYGFGHRMYLEHVVECIRENSQQLVDGFEGRRSLELILAIYESIETRQEISMHFRPTHGKLGRKS
jgi:predicted dehydrogenase